MWILALLAGLFLAHKVGAGTITSTDVSGSSTAQIPQAVQSGKPSSIWGNYPCDSSDVQNQSHPNPENYAWIPNARNPRQPTPERGVFWFGPFAPVYAFWGAQGNTGSGDNGDAPANNTLPAVN